VPQADLNVANQSGLAFRQDLNNQLLALGTLMSGSSAPSTTYAYMLWADTSTSPATIKQRNGANSAWIVVGTADTVNWGLLPAATAASTYAPLTGTGASGTWPISISGNAATATTATTANSLSGAGPLSATDYTYTADFPSVRPSLLLDFANSKALDPRVSFSRATTATYVGADGLIKTAAINEPRFDHSPSTGESLGLLIEEARTNIIVSSQSFNSGGWNQDGISLTASAGTAPDGTNTATSIVQGTANNRTYHFDNSGVTGSKVFSIFAKANAGTSLEIRSIGSMSPSATATVNLSSGTVSGFTGATIEKYPNGWYRVLLPVSVSTASGSSTYWTIFGPASSVLIWGAQLEAGAFPTSYIPTVAATVTRSADVAQMTGTNFSSWYNQNEGTVFCDFSPERTSNATRWAAQFGSTTTTGPNAFIIGKIGASSLYAETRVSSAGQYSVSQAMTSSRGKIAYAVANGSHRAAFDGTLATSGTGTFAALSDTILHIGKNVAGTEILCGTITRLVYWPKRLADAQIQNLTAV
jgi:hypothetical protein